MANRVLPGYSIEIINNIAHKIAYLKSLSLFWNAENQTLCRERKDNISLDTSKKEFTLKFPIVNKEEVRPPLLHRLPANFVYFINCNKLPI